MLGQIVFDDKRELRLRPRGRLKKAQPVLLVPFLLLWVGCVHLIANYDPITYKGLTDLKAETMLFLENMDAGKPYAEQTQRFEDLQLKIEKVYEYEKGKKLNNDTIAQLSEIRTMIQEITTRYKEQDTLSSFYLEEKKKQLETAFDLAIATESSKSKGNN